MPPLEAQQSGEDVAQDHTHAAQCKTLLVMAVGFEDQTGAEAAQHGLAGVDQNDEQGAAGAVVADEIGQTGVAAAVAADILLGEEGRDTDCAVEVTQQIGGQSGDDDSKPHA